MASIATFELVYVGALHFSCDGTRTNFLRSEFYGLTLEADVVQFLQDIEHISARRAWKSKQADIRVSVMEMCLSLVYRQHGIIMPRLRVFWPVGFYQKSEFQRHAQIWDKYGVESRANSDARATFL